MVFSKQDSAESMDKSTSSTTHSMPVTTNDKKDLDSSSNHGNSSSTISRLLPILSDNASVNLVSRYESSILNSLASINRIQTLVRFLFFSKQKFSFFFLFIEDIQYEKITQVNCLSCSNKTIILEMYASRLYDFIHRLSFLIIIITFFILSALFFTNHFVPL